MPQATDTLLSLEAVNFTYRALPVLRELSWHWREGEQWACIGPNGAGKTTLAGLLSKQLRHGSGVIERGRRLERGHCAYVCFEQQKALCDRDRQLDDSEFRADARDPGTTVAAALGRGALQHPSARTWIEKLNMGPILDRGIRFISTGEMRKTLLLRAVLQEPELLILDNPLDGLDRASQASMREMLGELLLSGRHILLLMRDIDALPEAISHLLVMDSGRVCAAGPRRDVAAQRSVQALMNPPRMTLGDLPAPAPRPYQLHPDEPLLELASVNVSYGDTAILENINWRFEAGRHCQVAGPNGCGKSTLLSLLTGDNHKAYGQEVHLFGQRRGSGESVWEIKQKFGLVNTPLHLNHPRGMKALDVVVSGFFDTMGLYDDSGGKQVEIARGWLRALGLDEHAATPFDTLSFGLQRMLLLARAMVKSPAILVLDEPCLGLDAYHTRTVLRAIDHIAANSDTQVLFVSHSMAETPDCINQWLEFVPGERGYTVTCRDKAPQGAANLRKLAQLLPSQ